ncbi:condensation domain-containing protein, partial [Rhodococcus sp. O3]|uniref:condensation domain-containing protein n=1 Tax=Rhodococcus sp. O3 TaxID=3404919 RepID=UPI003B67C6AB
VMHWLLDRSPLHHTRFSQAVLLELPLGIDHTSLTRTLQAVLDRHDMLRSRLRSSNGTWTWTVQPTGTVDAGDVLVRVAADPHGDDFDAIAHAELDAAADRLDPASGIVLQAVWFDPENTEVPGRLLLVIHHSAVDGVSWRILVPDLATAWSQIAAGQDPRLEAVGTSMRRWAHGLVEAAQQPERLAELDFWRATTAGDDPTIGSRPLDPATDVIATAEHFCVELPTGVTEALLTAVPDAFHGSVADGLLTALAVAVTAWRRDRGTTIDDAFIALEGHGREEQAVPGADLSRTVGWFTTGFPVRLDLTGIDLDDACGGGPALDAAVKSVKEQLLAVPDHGIGFGLLRYLHDETASDLREHAAPQIGFNYLGRIATGTADGMPAGPWMPVDAGSELGGAQDPQMPVPATLDINALTLDDSTGPRLRATWAFPTGILTADEVHELADLWCRVLTALVERARIPGSGGRTPSDLGLVTLRQAQIEELERRYPDLTDVWPLSPLQEGLLFHALVSEDSVDAYLVQLVLELRGTVDADRLRRAGTVLLDRHANLRTTFVPDVAGRPVQIVRDRVELPLTELDLSALPADDRDRELERIMAADRATRFDPARPPLMRWLLVTIGPDSHRLVMTNHHLLLDGWSTPLLVRELLMLYATDGDTVGLPRPTSYRDYLAWVERQDREHSLDEWARALAGVDEPTLVVPDDPTRRYHESRDVCADFGVEETAALSVWVRDRGATLNTVVQVAWGLVLGSLTSREDVTFGATVSGRPPQIDGVESMVGLFVNTVPVRVRWGAGVSLGELVDRVQAEQAGLLDHHYVGLSDVQRVAGPGAVFDTMTVFESYPVDRGGLTAETDIAGMRVVDVSGVDAAHYPMGLVAHVDDRLHLSIKYLPDLFGHDEITEILGRVRHIIGSLVLRPDTPIDRFSLLDDAERAELVPVTGGSPILGVTLPDILVASAAADPDTVAVVAGERRLTYRELDEQSNRLARRLIRYGVGPETVVAIAVPRSAESVLAVWAVAKTGAAFLPVDPNYPASRIEHLIADSAVTVGFTTAGARDSLPATVMWLNLDDPYEQASHDRVTDADRVHPLRIEHPAYVIYTSGSTGVPKGVTVTHGGLANLIAEQCSRFGLGPHARVLHAASPSFDAAVLEMLWAFGSGGCSVIAPPGVFGGCELAELLAREQVTHAA